MIEYEMTVNIKVENKEAIENLLITVESLNTETFDVNAVELISISALSLSNDKHKGIINNYEQDPWLSPLNIKRINNAY